MLKDGLDDDEFKVPSWELHDQEMANMFVIVFV